MNCGMAGRLCLWERPSYFVSLCFGVFHFVSVCLGLFLEWFMGFDGLIGCDEHLDLLLANWLLMQLVIPFAPSFMSIYNIRVKSVEWGVLRFPKEEYVK